MRPYIPFFSPAYSHLADSHKVFKYIHDDPGVDFIFYDHFLQVKSKQEKFTLRVDPVIGLELGRDLARKQGSTLSVNTRGVIANGNIGENFYFETFFVENQAFFPAYIHARARLDTVVPGQGRWKTFKTGGYDYAYSGGMISIQLGKQVNLQLGHGKHKVGNGYRSLLLSDNTFNYPFARITHQWLKGRLQYTNIYAQLTNLAPAAKIPTPFTERLFQRKAASFQYVSYNFSKRLTAALFQGTIWQTGDARNRQQLGLSYLNPLIFSNLLQYGFQGQHNVVAGLDLKLKIGKSVNLYGQLMADNPMRQDSSAQGFQAGVQVFDLFGIKHLFAQTEFNYVSEGSYTDHGSDRKGESYTHYQQNLAYTPGQGSELLISVEYRKSRLFMTGRYHYQVVPRGGKALYYLNYFQTSVGYVINTAYNLTVSMGYNHRNQNFYNFRANSNETGYLYFGLRTNLFNTYYDY